MNDEREFEDGTVEGGTVDAQEHDHESLLDRMRHSGVGVEDPNIVGDVGPVDVAPGGDGDDLIVEAAPGEETTIRP